MKQVRIIVAGGRDFTNYPLLARELDKYIEELSPVYRKTVEIVSGGCRGADKLGEGYSDNNKISLVRFPADWDTHGKKAGYLRNREMAEYAAEGIGVLFLFWDGKSRGSKNMLELAQRYGLEVKVVRY